MIFEHEIPDGSKLYFLSSAKQKRRIEKVASDILYKDGFEEIVTPLFSYHQHKSIPNDEELIRVNDTKNHNITLRADSTLDVVRIINKRLGKNTSHKKWFYIQPVFRYPSIEQYQVGAEFIGNSSLFSVMGSTVEIFNNLNIKPLIQISNMQIPIQLCKMFDLTLNDFRHINIEKFLALDIEWLNSLVYLQHVKDLDKLLHVVPDIIKIELLKMKELFHELTNEHVILSPLYYAKMLYYDELYFRMIDKNDIFASGGRYKSDGVTSVGFALFTDIIIQTMSKDKII